MNSVHEEKSSFVNYELSSGRSPVHELNTLIGGRVVSNRVTSMSAPVRDGDLAKVVLRIMEGAAGDVRMQGNHLCVREVNEERLERMRDRIGDGGSGLSVCWCGRTGVGCGRGPWSGGWC